MCLAEDAPFHKVLKDALFKNICVIIIDEAHCISQWGGDFWKHYGVLEKIWSLVPVSIPILTTTAMATDATLHDVCLKLGINPKTSFFLNLGKNQLNISMNVQCIEGTEDFDSLKPHLSNGKVSSLNDFWKSIVFVNSIFGCQRTCKKVHLGTMIINFLVNLWAVTSKWAIVYRQFDHILMDIQSTLYQLKTIEVGLYTMQDCSKAEIPVLLTQRCI